MYVCICVCACFGICCRLVSTWMSTNTETILRGWPQLIEGALKLVYNYRIGFGGVYYAIKIIRSPPK